MGRATALASRAAGDGLMLAYVRRHAHFTITARDAMGVRAFIGGEQFVVEIRGPSHAAHSLCDNQDGTYSCSWSTGVTGTYWVMVRLGGEQVEGSPFAAQVMAAVIDPSMCTVEGAQASPSHYEHCIRSCPQVKLVRSSWVSVLR